MKRDIAAIKNKINNSKAALKTDLALSKKLYSEVLQNYKKLGPTEEKKIYPDIKMLYREIKAFERISRIRQIFKKKKTKKPIKKETGENMYEDEISLAEIWSIIKKRKLFIAIGTVLIATLVVLFSFYTAPKLYESTSIISLGVEQDDVFSILQSKVMIQSSAILLPVIDEFFAEDEMDLETFKQKHLSIEIIQKRIDVRLNTLVPYLKITAKADTALKAKQINEKILENFLDYIKPGYEKETELTLKKIDAKNEEIKGLEIDIKKIKSTPDPGTEAEFIARKLIELRKRLSNTEIEKLDLEIQLLKKQKKYEIVSEPQVSEKLLEFEANSIIGLEGEKEDVPAALTAKILMESSTVLSPVIEEFFAENESMTLERFKRDHFNVEIIETSEGVNPRKKTALSYLKVTTKHFSNLKAKQMNQKILENFLDLVKPYNDIDYNLSQEKINILNQEILELKSEIGKFARKSYIRPFDEAQKPITISKLDSALSDINKRLNDAKLEKIDIEMELNQRNEYKIISHPQAPLELPRGKISIWLKALIGAVAGLFVSVLLVVYYDSSKKTQ